jgi:hypothetical protein
MEILNTILHFNPKVSQGGNNMNRTVTKKLTMLYANNTFLRSFTAFIAQLSILQNVYSENSIPNNTSSLMKHQIHANKCHTLK